MHSNCDCGAGLRPVLAGNWGSGGVEITINCTAAYQKIARKGPTPEDRRRARSIVLAEKQEQNRIPVFDVQSVQSGDIPSEYVLYECDGHESEYFALRIEGDVLADDGIFAGSIVIVHSGEAISSEDLFVVQTEAKTSIRKMCGETHYEGPVLGRIIAVVMRFV